MIKIVECPRDAMQGLPDFIPTDVKAEYINAILKVGFDTVDFGSFVSQKAIPQMRDTSEVLAKLDLSNTKSKLLSIVGNMRGATDACQFDEINYLGFPHSASPTFLKRNINTTIEKSRERVKEMLEICDRYNKELVVYLTMGFGNPYKDEWNVEIIRDEVGILYEMGVKIIPLSDTVGVSTKENIVALFSALIPEFSEIELGFHLHTSVNKWHEQVDAAFSNGCKRFDTVLLGLGGCPMAEDELVGNLKTVNLLDYLLEKGVNPQIDKQAFEDAYIKALQTFKKYIA
ncbi:MAG: hydroxymethylglutaryl-CoA lyase [Flavobacteriales bacterium]|nr:MAG: hydroxymethylglutaryl-CoA lyase [Flavobacteriales bacterium]